MWDKIKKFLGYAWASPVTAPGLIYAGMFGLIGWYKWHGIVGDALVWKVNEASSPAWLLSLWKKWGGHTIGNVIVVKQKQVDEKSSLMTHELRHVEQCMRLGIFQPIVYGISMLALKLGCPGSDPYYDCPFEIDARRAAGQPIDIVGTIKKIKSKSGEK